MAMTMVESRLLKTTGVTLEARQDERTVASLRDTRRPLSSAWSKIFTGHRVKNVLSVSESGN